MTVTSVAVTTTRFLFDMYDCTDDSDVGLGILHVCEHAQVRSHVSLGMVWSV